MRLPGRRYWWVVAAIVVIGGLGTVLTACLASPEFDPLGAVAWQVEWAGESALKSLRFADAERNFRVVEALGATDPARLELRLSAAAGLFEVMWAQGRYRDVVAQGRKIVLLAESEYGSRSKALIAPLRELAKRYRSIGCDSLADAAGSRVEAIATYLEPSHLRAVEIEEKRTPADPRALADCLINLGELYMLRDRPDLAELPYCRALELRAALESPLKEGPTEAQLRLAISSASLGKFTRAEAIYREILARQEKALSDTCILNVQLLESLAQIEHIRGRDSTAVSLLERSLRIRESHGKSPSLDDIETLTLLARCHSAEYHFEDALRVQARAVDIVRRAYGPKHLEVGHGLLDLATIQADAGRYEEARAASGEALAIFTAVLGVNHETTVDCRELYKRVGNLRSRPGDSDPNHARLDEEWDAG